MRRLPQGLRREGWFMGKIATRDISESVPMRCDFSKSLFRVGSESRGSRKLLLGRNLLRTLSVSGRATF